MESESNWIIEILRLVIALVGGVLGGSLKVRLSKRVSKQLNTINTRNTDASEQTNCGNVSLNAGTINFVGLQGKELDYDIAEESSEVIKSRTINRLNLTQKTILRMPNIIKGRTSDAGLRIDTGDVVYPLGVCLDSDEFDVNDREWLNLKPNSRNYLYFTYMGESITENKAKHVWFVGRSDVLTFGGCRRLTNCATNKRVFGKIDASGNIKYAEPLLVEDNIVWGNPNEEMMMKHGYRIVENAMPKCREGFFQKMIGWKDDGRRITPRFEEIPMPVQEGE